MTDALSIAPVARRLLGDPNRAQSTKTELRYGRKGSLAVDLAKDTWHDFEVGEGGGVLDLVCRERGGTRREAADWLRSEGLAEDEISRRREKVSSTRQSDRHAEARAIWEETKPALHTAAHLYLQARGVLIQPPAAIRYHEGINALVAGLQRADGTFAGVQRVYLDGDRHKGKRSLGPIKGAAVRLTPAAETIQLCESVEDACALLQLTGRPTWAVPGASFMASFEPPPEVREVVLAPDHDKAGLEAVDKARRDLHGVTLRQLLPPRDKDWCACLEFFEERAAILEYDAELIREEANRRSWVEIFIDGD